MRWCFPNPHPRPLRRRSLGLRLGGLQRSPSKPLDRLARGGGYSNSCALPTAICPPCLAGVYGSRCDRNAADLSRLEAGLVALAADHNAENLVGRVVEARISGGRITMSAEIGRSDYAARILAEIDDGLRVGFSPGFLVLEAEPLRNTDPAYDDEAFQVEITKHQIYEASSTAQPRNLDAVLLSMGGAQSMNGSMNGSTNMEVLGGPEIVHIDDEIGLALSTARVALRSGRGSKSQRKKLEAFISTYDDLRAEGQGRDGGSTCRRGKLRA